MAYKFQTAPLTPEEYGLTDLDTFINTYYTKPKQPEPSGLDVLSNAFAWGVGSSIESYGLLGSKLSEALPMGGFGIMPMASQAITGLGQMIKPDQLIETAYTGKEFDITKTPFEKEWWTGGQAAQTFAQQAGQFVPDIALGVLTMGTGVLPAAGARVAGAGARLLGKELTGQALETSGKKTAYALSAGVSTGAQNAQEVMQDPKLSTKQKNEAYWKAFGSTAALGMLTSGIEFDALNKFTKAFAKAGGEVTGSVIAKEAGLASRVGGNAKELAKNILGEGYQEVAEQKATTWAKNQAVDWVNWNPLTMNPEEQESFFLGGLMGGAFHGIGSVGDALSKRVKQANTDEKIDTKLAGGNSDVDALYRGTTPDEVLAFADSLPLPEEYQAKLAQAETKYEQANVYRDYINDNANLFEGDQQLLALDALLTKGRDAVAKNSAGSIDLAQLTEHNQEKNNIIEQKIQILSAMPLADKISMINNLPDDSADVEVIKDIINNGQTPDAVKTKAVENYLISKPLKGEVPVNVDKNTVIQQALGARMAGYLGQGTVESTGYGDVADPVFHAAVQSIADNDKVNAKKYMAQLSPEMQQQAVQAVQDLRKASSIITSSQSATSPQLQWATAVMRDYSVGNEKALQALHSAQATPDVEAMRKLLPKDVLTSTNVFATEMEKRKNITAKKDKFIEMAKKFYQGKGRYIVPFTHQGLLGERVGLTLGSQVADSDKRRFEIRNEFAGVNARRADYTKLSKAMDMFEAGESDDAIWKKTGWYFGQDREWRFEIDNSKAKLKKNLDMSIGQVHSLSDVYDLPALYDNYPELSNVDVYFDDLPPTTGGGARVVDGVPEIHINANRIKTDPIDSLNTVAHEVQHIIQAMEGFATGTSLENVKKKHATEIEGKVRDSLSKTAARFFDDMVASGQLHSKERLDKLFPHLNDKQKQAEYDKYRADRVSQIADELSQDTVAMQRAFRQAAFEIYYDYLGEVEAREAAARMGMTQKYKRETHPHKYHRPVIFNESTTAEKSANAFHTDMDTYKFAYLALFDGATDQTVAHEFGHAHFQYLTKQEMATIAKSFMDGIDDYISADTTHDAEEVKDAYKAVIKEDGSIDTSKLSENEPLYSYLHERFANEFAMLDGLDAFDMEAKEGSAGYVMNTVKSYMERMKKYAIKVFQTKAWQAREKIYRDVYNREVVEVQPKEKKSRKKNKEPVAEAPVKEEPNVAHPTPIDESKTDEFGVPEPGGEPDWEEEELPAREPVVVNRFNIDWKIQPLKDIDAINKSGISAVNLKKFKGHAKSIYMDGGFWDTVRFISDFKDSIGKAKVNVIRSLSTQVLGDLRTRETKANKITELVNKSPKLLEWAKDSAVRDEDGKLSVLFHGTGSDNIYSDFRVNYKAEIGAHFGTIEQANFFITQGYANIVDSLMEQGKPPSLAKAIPNSLRVYPVVLNIKKPLYMRDVFGGAPETLLKGLVDTKKLSNEAISKLTALMPEKIDGVYTRDTEEMKAFHKAVAAEIKKAGYDGIMYWNDMEGDGMSYIALEPNQIKSVYNSAPKDTNNIMASRTGKTGKIEVGLNPKSRHAHLNNVKAIEFTNHALTFDKNRATMDNLIAAGWKSVPVKDGVRMERRKPSKFQTKTKLITGVLANGHVEESPKGVINNIKAKIDKAIQKFYTAMVDDLNPLEILGQSSPEMAEVYKSAWVSRGWTGLAKSLIELGKKGIDLNDGQGKIDISPLKDIMAKIPQEKLLDFEEYLIAKRVIDLAGRKDKDGNPAPVTQSMTLEEAKRIVAGASPEFKSSQKELVNINRYLLREIVKAGMLSESSFQWMIQNDPNYVPLYKDVTGAMDEGDLASIHGRSFVNIQTPIKRMKGSTKDIISPLEAIVNNIYRYHNIAERQKVGQKFILAADGDEMLGDVFKEVHGVSAGKQNSVIKVYFNGKGKFYQVTPEIYDILSMLNQQQTNTLLSLMAKPAALLRAGVTISPDFSARNFLRDQFTAFLFSRNGYMPFFDAIRGMRHVMNKDDVYRQYLESGAAQADFASLENDYSANSYRKLLAESGWLKMAKQPLVMAKAMRDTLMRFSEMLEVATRVGEFENAKLGYSSLASRFTGKNIRQYSDMQAALAARDITIDFNRAGTWGRAVNRYVAFFNANVQGVDKMRRELKENTGELLIKCGLITIASLALFAANKDDDRYKELPRWQKDLFWIFMGKDYMFKLPKPFEIGILFGSGAERLAEYYQTNNPKAFKGFMNAVIEGFTPNLMVTALQPSLEVLGNYSVFRERPIVPVSEQGKAAHLQYGATTSEFAKTIGKWMGWSPRKIDHLIQSHTGSAGSGILSVTDKLAGKEMPTKQVHEWLPVAKAFTITPYQSSQSVQDFYEGFKKMNELKSEVDAKTKPMSAFNKAKYDAANKVNRGLSEIHKQVRETMESKTLSPDAKRAKIDQLKVREINLAKIGLKSVE